MILLDVKSDKIHASILNKGLIPKYQGILEEGAAYIIQNILVTQNSVKYKTSSHRFKLNFMGNTICSKIEDEVIPNFQFDFMSLSDILSSTTKDVLIEKDNIKEIVKNGKKDQSLGYHVTGFGFRDRHRKCEFMPIMTTSL
ncbi:hypothetical protein JHK82_022280 [Glycine max]|nr:hypothetical protein JHK87_022204 [Glycine soja]KAG5016634.1 hypothetical protein JHK85_022770 [Glycine max]KAG5026391.1 hypothetical protein JHK86_022305 [Glycine max]KAG5137549.1 hypothetical protein JHK82_022280 [Glycine max]KHM98805.1 hypothetical protein glysoja_022215 [Glycine soja]